MRCLDGTEKDWRKASLMPILTSSEFYSVILFAICSTPSAIFQKYVEEVQPQFSPPLPCSPGSKFIDLPAVMLPKSGSLLSSWDAGYIFLLERGEMVIVKVAYLQRFACSHRQCENTELNPACCWAVSALAVISEHSAPLLSDTKTLTCWTTPGWKGLCRR